MPIIFQLREGMPVLDTFKEIFEQQRQEVTCRVRPSGVQQNAVFLVDLKHIVFNDLSADDNGAWRIASPRRKYVINLKGNGKCRSVVRAGDDYRAYTLVRQYMVNVATKATRSRCGLSENNF